MPKSRSIPPRLYCIVAKDAQVAVVFRRGPSHWWHILRWDLDRHEIQPGAWFRGWLYPRRSDISPDGKFLHYFALKHGKRAEAWLDRTYSAVSKLPWLRALAAWKEYGTWTMGYHFRGAREQRPPDADIGAPNIGALPASFVDVFQLIRNDVYAFPVERAHGWNVHPAARSAFSTILPVQELETPCERCVLSKDQPEGVARLFLIHDGSSDQRQWIENRHADFALQCSASAPTILPGAAWADWDHRGRLLTATTTGFLRITEVRDAEQRIVWEQSLLDMTPNPEPAPPEAHTW